MSTIISAYSIFWYGKPQEVCACELMQLLIAAALFLQTQEETLSPSVEANIRPNIQTGVL